MPEVISDGPGKPHIINREEDRFGEPRFAFRMVVSISRYPPPKHAVACVSSTRSAPSGVASIVSTSVVKKKISRLPLLMLEAGLPHRRSVAVQRLTAPATPVSSDYFDISVRVILPLIERLGIATADEVDVATLPDRVAQDAISHAGSSTP
jgi:hypothetical protein